MSKLKQLIGLQASNLSVRATARALGLSVGAVSKYLQAVRAAAIEPAEAEALSEAELEQRIFGPALPAPPSRFVPPDCTWIHTELKRHRHVTLQLLWEEYAARHGEAAYRRSAFCTIYRRWEKRLKRSMRQRHFAGEKLFVDYAGRTVLIHVQHSQEIFQAQLFVCAMGASGYVYAEATRTQGLSDWLASHVRALTFYGAAPTIIVPDNPKVGVTRADRYEPQLTHDVLNRFDDAKVDLLYLDDFGLSPLITSQLPVDQWHTFIAEPTLADAILDRLVHNSHRLNLRGDSMRKHKRSATAQS